MYRPTTSRTLAMNSGSVDSFHVLMTCGLRPKARQIRETDDCDRPVSSSVDRVDQWLSWPRPFSVRTPGDRGLALLIGDRAQRTGPGRVGQPVQPLLQPRSVTSSHSRRAPVITWNLS